MNKWRTERPYFRPETIIRNHPSRLKPHRRIHTSFRRNSKNLNNKNFEHRRGN
jgi:hypothetical protein